MHLSPVLFYFWAHNVAEELDTDSFRRVVDRADVVFREYITDDMSAVDAIESAWNTYISAGLIRPEIQRVLSGAQRDGDGVFLAELMRGTGKRMVLERSLPAPFDYYGEQKAADRAFFSGSFEEAVHAQEAFLRKSTAYQVRREAGVYRQILSISSPVAVVFGAGHPDLEAAVAYGRPTEIHYPYEGYGTSFETRMTHHFRKTGQIDRDLLCRYFMEGIALKQVKTACPGHTLESYDKAARWYAASMAPDQILEFKESLVSASHVYGRYGLLERFAARAGLPAPEELLSRLSCVR